MKELLSPMKSFYLGTAGLFLFLLIFNGCGKRSDIMWVYYDETRCADRWVPDANNEKLKDNIVRYYKDAGVRIYDLEIFSDRTPETCPDCLCKTGRRVKAKIKGKDLKPLKTDGFYQE